LAGRAHTDGAGAGVEGLTGEAVTAFLLAEVARGLRLGSLQGRVAELRSLLRFLYVAGLTHTGLAESVPPVPGWKQTRVPPRMSAADVDALVASCDPSTGVGRRDMAMLLLLARLGLRAAEVIGLELDDLDWRAGELVVPGKGRRLERMPLSAEVGEALTAYLIGARPRVKTRTVFVTVVAPHRPLAKNTLSARWCGASAHGQAWTVFGRTASGTRWRATCWTVAPPFPRSARCFAIGTWPPPRCTRRSITPSCGSWPGRGR
jgi:site-specific recombinase XerD